jgi:hypothetical protein
MKLFLPLFVLTLGSMVTTNFAWNQVNPNSATLTHRPADIVHPSSSSNEPHSLWINESFGSYAQNAEVIEKRDANSKTFRTGGNVYTAFLTSGDVHYQEDGKWKTIFHTISPSSDGFQNTTNRHKTYYPATSKGSIKTVLPNGASLIDMKDMRMYYIVNEQVVQSQAIQNKQGMVDYNKLTYSNVYGAGINLRLTQNTTQRKMDYIIQNASALANIPSGAQFLVFEEKAQLPSGWTAQLVNNEILLKDASGNVVAKYEKPVYNDTHVHHEDEEGHDHGFSEIIGTYEIVQNGNLLTIKTKVPVEWLTNSERNFPIVIDPTVNLYPNASARWTGSHRTYSSPVNYASTNIDGASSDGNFYIGRNSTNYIHNGWIKYNVSSIPISGCINSAILSYNVIENNTYEYDCAVHTNFRHMASDPSVNSFDGGGGNDQARLSDIRDGSIYGTHNLSISASGDGWQSWDLTANMADLSAQIPAGWFAIGMHVYAGAPTHSTCRNTIAGHSHSLKPHLVVQYSMPPPPIAGNNVLCVGQTTQLSYTMEGITGGTIAYANGYKIHTFTGSGTFNVPAGVSGDLDVLVVGGGGGARGDVSGGGGGGGVRYGAVSVSSGAYSIVVGAGGAGALPGSANSSGGSDGSPSSAFGIVANGGGKGGLYNQTGGAGASGGGGGGSNGSGGAGNIGEGNAGGAGTSGYRSGGGGGAGYQGGSATSSAGGNGGNGIMSNISGTDTWYGGGGGGGFDGSAVGNGGLGGGGNGKNRSTNSPGNNGAPNTGGGAGGNAHPHYGGASGGSGIVIIRYPYGTWSTSNPSVATVSSTGLVTAVGPGTANIYNISQGYCEDALTTIVVTDSDVSGLVLKDDPSACSPQNGVVKAYIQEGNFKGTSVWYRNSFSSATPEVGAHTIGGSATLNNNNLRFTEAINSQSGTLTVTNPGLNASSVAASFDLFIGNGNGADGFQFTYGDIKVRFDTWNNSDPNICEGESTSGGKVGVGVYQNNVLISGGCRQYLDIRNAWHHVFFHIDIAGRVYLKVGNTVVFNYLPLTNQVAYDAANKSSWTWSFFGHTGGMNDEHRIDNLHISAFNQYSYQLNGGTWQSSNTFSNVGSGTHTVNARPRVNGTCTQGTVGSIKNTVPSSVTVTPSPATACVGDNITLSATITPANTATLYALLFPSAYGTGWHGLQEIRGYNAAGTQQALNCATASSATYTTNICGDASYGAGNAFDGDLPGGVSGVQWLTPKEASISDGSGVNTNWRNYGSASPFYAPEYIVFTSAGPLAELQIKNGRYASGASSTCFKDYHLMTSTDNGVTWTKIKQGTLANDQGTWQTIEVLPAETNYVWTKGGTVVGTGKVLTLSNVTAADAGTYTLKVGYDVCNTVTTTVDVVISTPSTAPTSVTGGGNHCHGHTVTLTANGGTLGSGASYHWYTGSCGGTLVATTSTPTYSFTPPVGTTTYYVRAEGPCNTTACVSTTVTLPSTSTALAVNGESATCIVGANETVVFYHPVSGRYITTVTAGATALGSTTATVYVDLTNQLVPACDMPQEETAVMQRHWVINPTVNGPATVRLPYTSSELSNLATASMASSSPHDLVTNPNQSTVFLSKYSGPLNVNASALDNCPATGGNGNTTLHTNNGVGSTPVTGVTALYSDFAITSFSEFWLHGSDNVSPLGIDLTSFSAFCEDNNTRVEWITASEVSTSHFILERSRNGYDWAYIGQVPAQGSSTSAHVYAADDVSSGSVYYRLLQVDTDGKVITYGPIYANCQSNNNDLTVYPNPTKGTFTVAITATTDLGSTTVAVKDLNGKIISLQEVDVHSGVTTVHFSEQQLMRGTYFVTVKSQEGKQFIPVKLVVY